MGDERDPLPRDLAPDLAPKTPPPPEEAKDGKAPSFEIPPILQIEDERELLRRLHRDDPFEVNARVPRRMRERAVLLPATKLATYTMARMAITAKSYRGSLPIEEWVEMAVEISIDDMLDEVHEEERRGIPVPDSEDYEFYAELADVFGCPVLDARMALVTLNGMSESHRLAFQRVLVQGMTVQAWAEESCTTKRHIHDLLREVGVVVHGRLNKRRMARRRRRL